ncbi:MAG: hypothetical protein EBU70_09295 [Actinobacteria bacterium]|nr:hypothetical protein [Actinomycetota bacterium]
MLTITIDTANVAPEDVVRERLGRACAGSALAVGSLSRSGTTSWTAEIRPAEPAIVLGTASYVEVLHRISRAFPVSNAAITAARRVAEAC